MLLLSPWLWYDDAVFGYWGPPSGCRAAIDLASLGQIEAAIPGQPRGWGIFDCDEIPRDLVDLGGVALASDDIRDARPDGKMLDAWQSLLGYRPNGETFADLVWDQLTAGSDPQNADRSGVLMPTTARRLELLFGGSVLRRDRFDFGQHPHTAQVTAVIKRQLEQARIDALDGKLISPVTRQPDGEYHRRILDSILEKYAGRNESLKAELLPLVKPDSWLANEGALPHATTITDDFNRANSSGLGSSGEGWSWTAVVGRLDISGNQAIFGTGTNPTSRAESDLSSADHYAQWTRTASVLSTNYVMPSCRYAGAATTYYCAAIRPSTPAIYKRVTGTFTLIIAGVSTSGAAGDVIQIRANGSTISQRLNGAEDVAHTDTVITGGTRTGVDISQATKTGDDFSAADLVAGSGVGPIFRGRAMGRGEVLGGSALVC